MDSRTKQMILSTLCKHFSLDSGGAGASTGCFEPPLEEGHCFHLSEMWRLVEMSFSGHTYGWLSDGTVMWVDDSWVEHYGLNINKASLFHCKSKR
ncbi:hypothetical protein DY000_02006084 [Brassica cretica]|uniref:Uncharacterized protein n=1 Tax=Brassica cretica TaxID=69181 RepID=A0ABQ7CBK5_BRACR|nr:hypothetical protein DY000_02006084 [Brassica cretica]